MHECPTDEQLACYAAGENSDEEAEVIRTHIAGCAQCAQWLTDADANEAIVADVVQAYSDRDKSVRRPARAVVSEISGKVDPNHDADSLTGERPTIKGYEIVRTLSHGGQGVVYQAIQRSTKRKVAVKVLLHGPHASRSARKRFEREIELVANLKHPNIIAVFDSGVTPEGRPFYVMDYMRGVALHTYVRETKLKLEDTLQLFKQVCDAVNYAHQKGVIHRDLKPSNILVDAEGSPKVLDFGLAKPLAGPVETLISMTGQVVGTLPYTSPEQARGNPDEMDIRTDVYSLGVVLYELLTGHYPYPVVGHMADVLRHITDTPPTPPSRVWSAASGVKLRSTRRLRQGACPIDEEVQTIVLKALSKERERRYQGAGDLARDIVHYLAGEPIEAKRDSNWYMLKKTLRRYRAPVAAAAGFIVLLGISLTVIAGLYFRAETAKRAEVNQRVRADQEAREAQEQRDTARREAAKARQTEMFLRQMLGSIDPRNARGRDVTVLREVLDAAADRLDKGTIEDPAVESALRLTIGLSYRSIASYDLAEGHLQAALRQARRAHGDEEHLDVARALDGLGTLVYHRYWDYKRVEGLFREALRIRRKLLEPQHPDIATSAHNLARVLQDEGMYEEAESLHREALRIRRRIYGDTHESVAKSENNLGELLYWMGAISEAEAMLRDALRTQHELIGYDHPDYAESLITSAWILQSKGKLEEAEELLRKAYAIQRRVLGDEHPHTGMSMLRLLYVQYSLGRMTEAEELLKLGGSLVLRHSWLAGDGSSFFARLTSVAERLVESNPAGFDHLLAGIFAFTTIHEHPNGAAILVIVGYSMSVRGNIPAAITAVQEGLRIRRKKLAEHHPDTAATLALLGALELRAGRPERAHALINECVEMRARLFNHGHWLRADASSLLGECFYRQGRYQDAERLLVDSYTTLWDSDAAPLNRKREALIRVVDLYSAWGKTEQAAEWRAKLAAVEPSTPE